MLKESILMVLQNSDDFKELEEKIYKLICETVRNKLKEVLELIDEEIMKNRDKEVFKNKDKKSRTIKTIVGPIELERRYYRDIQGNYHFLLDEYLNIPDYDRQSPGLKEAAIMMIKDMPYRKSAEKIEDLLKVSVSHSAIHNWVQDLGEKIAKEEDKKRHELFEFGAIPEGNHERQDVGHMFIEADGIHLHLQKEEKSSGELKLSMSYRGWEKRHPSSEEYRLTLKKYYGGVFESNKFWEQTSAKMYEYYSFDKDAVTVLNGDGANWVSSGQDYIPAISTRLLDSFHWSRKIYRCLGRSSYIPKIYDAIEDYDKEALKDYLDEARSYRKKKKDKKKVDELETYLLNHWEGLKDYREKDLNLPDNVRGMGAMESNIDKVLANRMKKRGMRWSKAGARNLAKIIIADKNNELEDKMAQINWDIEKDKIEKEYRTVKDKISSNKNQVKRGKMPVLNGPFSGKDWTKSLRNIGDAIQSSPISA